MPTVRMRAPRNFGALSLDGRAVEIGSDGGYNADHRDVPTLTAHGFTPWADGFETMAKPQLIEECLARGRAELEKMDVEDLRRRLTEDRDNRREEEGMPSDADIAAAKVDANAVTPMQIAGMNRNELFAYLKAEGVSAPLPIKNDRLREIALDTLERKKAA